MTGSLSTLRTATTRRSTALALALFVATLAIEWGHTHERGGNEDRSECAVCVAQTAPLAEVPVATIAPVLAPATSRVPRPTREAPVRGPVLRTALHGRAPPSSSV